MNDTLDDWQITAYALGHADAAMATEVARRADASAEVRERVRQTRAVGAALAAGVGRLARRWEEGLTLEQKALLRREGAAARPAAPRRREWMRGFGRWAAAAALGVALVLALLASPPGSTFLTATYAWLDQVKSSSGHDTAARTAWAGPPVTIRDVLSGRGPGDMMRAGLAGETSRSLGRTTRDDAGQERGAAAVGGPGAALREGSGSRAMVVKRAELVLQVARLAPAMDRAAAIASQHAGFVEASQLRTATSGFEAPEGEIGSVTLRVPSTHFEDTVAALHDMAVRVVEASISGSDVTGEYVDLRSQVANLEATTARVRAFLDDAATVDEALRVNAELSRLEGEIGILRGRMEVMADQAAMSTIRVDFLTDLPEATLQETPEWDPGATVEDAWSTLVALTRNLITVVIWLTIVVVPLCAPILLLAWWLHRRRARS